MKRIGIYSGTFDPVHAGHIAFALQAVKAAKLDRLIFLPERRPRYKQGMEHFGHRVAMLRRATRPYRKFEVLEMIEPHFTVRRTLKNLQNLYPDSELVFLAGSDAVLTLPDWPDYQKMLNSSELLVGVRASQKLDDMAAAIAAWPQQPRKLTLVKSWAGDVSSSSIREAIRSRRAAKGLLASVANYSRQNWLYVTLHHLAPNNH